MCKKKIYIFVHPFLRYKLVVFLAPPIVQNENALVCLFPKTDWTYPIQSVIYGYTVDELWAFISKPRLFAITFWFMAAIFIVWTCSFSTVMCLTVYRCCIRSLVLKNPQILNLSPSVEECSFSSWVAHLQCVEIFWVVNAACLQVWSTPLLCLSWAGSFKSLKRGSSAVAILSHALLACSWREARSSLNFALTCSTPSPRYRGEKRVICRKQRLRNLNIE